ncbi:MAG: hypothetical protein ACI8PZ_006107 [Myxococcota bacterium]|jgi:hypothetical protein
MQAASEAGRSPARARRRVSRKVPDALADAARLDGRRRSDGLGRSAPAPAVAPPSSVDAAPLVVDASAGIPVYTLAGRRVRVGDVLELYTNSASGWLRGRFEWTESVADRPRIAVNLWDPTGPRDEDGLPPWVGALDAPLPAGAMLRWPRSR